MKTFNVTAQVYESNDTTKQTLLINREVNCLSETQAKNEFENNHLFPDYKLVRIYSVMDVTKGEKV